MSNAARRRTRRVRRRISAVSKRARRFVAARVNYRIVEQASFAYAWTFPAMLALVVMGAVGTVLPVVSGPEAPVGTALAARLSWGVAAMLFSVLFAFTIGVCHTLMFRCGKETHAFAMLLALPALGLVIVLLSVGLRQTYLGPSDAARWLDATAFAVPGVRTLTAVFDGFALWAAMAVVATSCVIVRNEVTSPELLSRQLRGSRILMTVSAALLVSGVAETSALHKWPASEPIVARQAARIPEATSKDDVVKLVETTATAISASVGTTFSLILTAAYLPLGIILRQRAYRIIRPWERTESWLSMQGFGLMPTQQLGKILLILSPLMAGGPVNYLINLLSN